ncbi:MAG: SGNH/GDSL hydrolase family protein [Polyangiales bacterium]
MSNDSTRWLMKVVQPARTLSSLPGGAGLSQDTHAALLGLSTEQYLAELAAMKAEASAAAHELLADPAVVAMVDRLALRSGAKVVAFGDSLTSDPQSWALILSEVLSARRAADEISLTVSAVAGDTTTHALVRFGEVVAQQPDWILFLIGTNDARTQGPHPSKTLVHPEETARNIAELRQRTARETKARSLWITPPAVNEEKVAGHWGLARFGVRFRNEDLARVGSIVSAGDVAAVDASAALETSSSELLMGDGLHLTVAGQKRLALAVLEGWSRLHRNSDPLARRDSMPEASSVTSREAEEQGGARS